MEPTETAAPFIIELKVRANDDLAQLCKQYWEINTENAFTYKVSDLSREFGISIHQLPKVVAEHCSATSSQDSCTSCGAPYVFSSRADFQQRLRSSWSWQCELCIYKERELQQAEQKLAQQRFRDLIQSKYSLTNSVMDCWDLSLESAVYYLAFARLCATEDFSFAVPLDSVKRQLSPTPAFDFEILCHLNDNEIITANPNSALEAFVREEASRFYPKKVMWNLPCTPLSNNPKDFASELEELLRSEPWPPHWSKSRISLWEKVALQECLQYLAYTLTQHGLALNPGEKTLLVFTNALKDFSVAQIYGFIWRAAKDAAAYYVRERIPKQQAANTVVGAIQRQAERAKAESWDIKPYGRVWDCPQSMLSEVLFNAVLKIGEAGFNKVPVFQNLPR